MSLRGDIILTMKILDLFEKIIGTLYILVSLIPIPFAGPLILQIISSANDEPANQYFYLYLISIPIFFFVISLILTKKVDFGQLKTGRRIRRFFYFTLMLIPIVILIMKIVYPQGGFNIGV